MTDKHRLEELTEAEFLELIREFFENRTTLRGDAFGRYLDDLLFRFKEITENPLGSDLIYYPGEGADDSPEGVLERVKQWRAANGKPGFKPA
ncbi:bacteriocin immunity protein [Pseudomonas putida]|uniref:bacteriocin immunity protein n=1 Tax=Pseudomonas putida TaxID=303 RepID=UPI000818FB2A|nr:bacteriocin immunity protein [Pseudomonas putida]OCT22549.1 bacteriocin immunity protein [Pseudomonas putida]OCT23520.1 bacteriocin immunity protein [Pseudomonas putida]OCT24765.1 bacteriocin immunity protein [Pseudomonas putida]OCT37512.1 bacteriocin immunity protein [Pseudomonas putida]